MHSLTQPRNSVKALRELEAQFGPQSQIWIVSWEMQRKYKENITYEKIQGKTTLEY